MKGEKGNVCIAALLLATISSLVAWAFHCMSMQRGKLLRTTSERTIAALEAENVFEYATAIVLNREALPSWSGMTMTFPDKEVLGINPWLYQQFEEVASDPDFVSTPITLTIPKMVASTLPSGVTANLSFLVQGLKTSPPPSVPWPLYDSATNIGYATIVLVVKITTSKGKIFSFERPISVSFFNGDNTP